LREALREVLGYFTPDWLASLSGYDYILSALSVAGINSFGMRDGCYPIDWGASGDIQFPPNIGNE
jgi:hypothetical protein